MNLFSSSLNQHGLYSFSINGDADSFSLNIDWAAPSYC